MRGTDHMAGHLKDLAEQSFQHQIYTFTNFLTEGEQEILMAMHDELRYAGISMFGGTQHSDRVVARFGSPEEFGYEQPFPIVCLKAQPVAEKYSEELSHRDYLGALMGLGIERDLIGDIYPDGTRACIFCMEHIAEYIMENLRQVRHTNIKLSVLETVPDHIGPDLEDLVTVVSSERLDAVISKVFNLSRSQSIRLFQSDKVMINGIQSSSGSTICREGSKISVRGFGKFIYAGSEGVTGKGRIRIRVRIYR